MTTEVGGPARESEQRSRYGRLAGALFVTGAVTTLPASFLLEPEPPAEIFLLTALGVVSGLVCWWLPWQRLPDWSLDVLTTAGTLEVLLVCVVVDEAYRLLYFAIAVFAAVALPTRGRVGIQIAVIVLALLAPVLYEDAAREQVRIAMLAIPVMVIVTGAVRYLGEMLEQRERASRAFAREAITLAIRLRRGTPGQAEEGQAEVADLERALHELR